MRAGDGKLEVEIAPASMALMLRSKGVGAVPAEKLQPLSADEVCDTLERVRR